jgi:signal transduction histidine kinase/ActR/RegA family two-component response regulator
MGISTQVPLKDSAHGASLLAAVNAAAASLQRSARSESDVYQAFREQIIALGLSGGLGSLEDSGNTVKIKVLAIPTNLNPILSEIERKLPASPEGFRLSIDGIEVYREVIESGKSKYLADINPIIRQLIRTNRLETDEMLIKYGGHLPAIFAPLVVEGNIFGLINIAGQELVPEDIPAFEAFSNHIGIALENAHLISTLRQREESYRLIAERLTAIREIDQAILTARSKEVIAQVCLERLRILVPFQRASVTLFDIARGLGHILALYSEETTQIEEFSSFDLDFESDQVKKLLRGEMFVEKKIIEEILDAELAKQLNQEGITNLLNVPLIIQGDEIIGSINLGRETPEPFADDQIEVVSEVAELLAVAIQDSRYLESELRRRQEAETLINITAEMTSSLEMDQVLDGILVHLNRVVPYDSACIFLMMANDHLRAVACRGFTHPENVLDIVNPADDNLTVQILSTRQPVILQDAKNHPSFNRWGDTEYTQGWMGVPLIVRESAVGILTVDSKTLAAFGPAEAELAQAVANQAAITIENARLFSETQRLLMQTGKQAAQLQQIMDLVPDGIVMLDEKKRIVLTNQAATSYLAQLADARVGDILHQLSNVPLDKLLERGTTKTSWHEITAVEPGGIYEVSSRPLDLSVDNPDWLLILRNVTDERKEEGYLRTQERLATVGQLAAGIAHDFNNIMTVISLYTQLVLQTPNVSSKDQQRLNTIQQQAERASQLIRKILDFSRQSVVDRRPVDLRPFVKDLTRSWRQSLPDNLNIEADVPDGEYLVEADTARLRQALTNLAINARDAMPWGGNLRLCLGYLMLSGDQVYPLPDMKAGQWITLTISDTGEGIKEKDLSRIFEPFYTTKPTGEGTGLGLAQVYGIVKLHDGFINVESRPGHGTIFSIYLPAFLPPIEDDSSLDIGKALGGSGETILIVEDDPDSREALGEILESLNYKVLTAPNGTEALSIYEELNGQIDLVLSDMVMPVMDGAALYAELKARDEKIKMIVITGYPLDRGGKELLNRGVVAYIQKPLQVEVIAHAIRDALTNGR